MVYLVLYLVNLTDVESVVLLCTVVNFNSFKFSIIHFEHGLCIENIPFACLV